MRAILKKVAGLVVVLGLLALCVVLVNERVFADDALKKQKSEVEEYYYPDDYIGYMYPVLPETEEWPYGNHQDMVDISQIPETIYKTMPTMELLESVLSYPLIGDMLTYDDFSVGYKVVKEHFGALKELSERDDNCVCLEELRQKYIDAELHESNESEERNEYEDEKPLSIYEKKRSRTIIRNMVLVVLKRQDDFTMDKKPAYVNKRVIGSSILLAITDEIRNLEGVFLSVYDMIYVNSFNIFSPRGGIMTGAIYKVVEEWLQPDGSSNYYTLDDLSVDAKAALNNDAYSTYGLTPITGYGPTVKYNCHSYTWYEQVYCNYWVAQFNSSGYTQVDWQNVNTGGIAVYYNTYDGGMGPSPHYTHSAIVVANSYGYMPQEWSLMRSKWGRSALYTHGLANCPYYYVSYIPMSQPQPCDMVFYN